MTSATEFAGLTTPCLVLDESRMAKNIQRMASKARSLGVTLRPHLKTAKSIEVAKQMTGGIAGPVTVSTMAEAEEFHRGGYDDIIYAVGIAPPKLQRIRALREAGCDLKVILDSAEQARAVSAAGIPALIEIDSDGHRGGVNPTSSDLIEIGRILSVRGLLRGVITHAGGSYSVCGDDAHAAFAEQERVACVTAAEALRSEGLPVEIVSVGSTPTASAARDLTGVTEMRPGVYVFQDLVMAGIGVCALDDIALSVLTTVIGHQKVKGWILVDAGWMAMSRDRGTGSQAVDQGYGLVCGADGQPFDDLIMKGANQEHGIIALRDGAAGSLPDLPVGTLLRILPNHACATAAQHGEYHVVAADKGPMRVWPRFGGW